jgi:hypothetical protein
MLIDSYNCRRILNLTAVAFQFYCSDDMALANQEATKFYKKNPLPHSPLHSSLLLFFSLLFYLVFVTFSHFAWKRPHGQL